MAQTPEDYLSDHYEGILGRLLEFVRIPSISADPAYRESVIQAANWIAGRLSDVGLEQVEVKKTNGNPVVYAQWLKAPGKPTVLVYGHYDVQPVDPLEKWNTEPFTPTIKDERLYARGASDDKGPVLVAVEALNAILSTLGELPVNVKFLLEGEEEIGSPSIDTFMRNNTDLLACDFVLSADGAMWRISEPSLTVASRGMASLEFGIYGPKKDLHSGRHGGSIANPLHALSELVASLHTPDGRIDVDGFYDGVEELTEQEKAQIRALPFDENDYLDEVGSPAGFGEPGYSLLERQWVRPTLDVVGMGGGYHGEGIKTVIPSEAHAKISCRLVPGQDPEDIKQKIIRHLEQHHPAGVTLKIKASEGGVPAYRLGEDHIGLQTAQKVLRELYQQEPLKVRIGATLPIAEAFRHYLHADTVFFSFSTADEDFHAPNEFFRLQRFKEGLLAWTAFFKVIGRL